MKNELLDIITEAYNNDELSAEDAVAYADFVEYADLDDDEDVEILTEMVDTLTYDDDYYMMEKKTDTKNDSKEKKKSKFKAKLANAKAFVSRNKGKIAAGALGAAGIAGAAGLGYAAGRTGSDRRNAATIQGLNAKLDETRSLFKQANAAKRSATRANADLGDRIKGLQNSVNAYKRADAYRNAKAGVADYIQSRRRDGANIDMYRPDTASSGDSQTTRLLGTGSSAPRSLAPSSSSPKRLSTSDISSRNKPIQVSNRKPGGRPGRR